MDEHEAIEDLEATEETAEQVTGGDFSFVHYSDKATSIFMQPAPPPPPPAK